MTIIHEPLRYAHDEGHTDVCYSEDGDTFITCGSDGDIRIWSATEGEDPQHKCIGEWALSVRQKDDKIYVATGTNEIQILTHPDGERDGVLTRSTDPFNQIALCKNKNVIALASEGMEVLVMDLDTRLTLFSYKELTGPCLSVAVCPNAMKIATSSGDGKLRVWDVDSSILVKEITCFPVVNSFSNAKTLCRIDFDPIDGKHLAYPIKNSVKLLNTTSWNTDTLNCNDNITGTFSIVQFSTCGNYLAAATDQGDFVIWQIKTKKIFKTSKHDSNKCITGMMWNPKQNGEIVYTDIDGELSIMSNCTEMVKVPEVECNEIDEYNLVENETVLKDYQSENVDDDDDDDENVISVEKLKQQYSCQLDDDDEDINKEKALSSRLSTPRPYSPKTLMQSHFMPTSTPEHFDPRYLCYNETGIVKSYGNNSDDDDLSTKTIEVEFHDTTFHNSMMVPNFHDYTMGSISQGALVTANATQLAVVPLQASNKTWNLTMDGNEEIILIACSKNLVCFAMANYIIRICSIYGTQRAIVSVPGQLISMVAYENDLMVAHHIASTRNNDQCINIKLFKFESISVKCFDLGSALGPESTLSWIGFSDVGTPGMLDSLGMLSLYLAQCNTWIPFCDTTKHRTSPGDTFFVTSVFETYQAVGGIKCKGTVYPGFIPRPTMCELPLEPPFAESATEKTQMEMGLFTWSNLHVMDTDRKIKESALKLFALACKNDFDQRAYEFLEILNNPQIVNLGIKYASRLNKKRLIDKLTDLVSKLQENQDNETENNVAPTIADSSSSIIANTSEKSGIERKNSRFSLKSRKPKKPQPPSAAAAAMVLDDSTAITNDNLSMPSTSINTQESLFSQNESMDDTPSIPFSITTTDILSQSNGNSNSKNPFLKRTKTAASSSPLSLTDKFAGVDYEKNTKKQQSSNNDEIGNKRKHSDNESEKTSNEKQRKLDRFMFTKTS